MLSFTVFRFPSTQSLLFHKAPPKTTNATFPINPPQNRNTHHKFNFQQTASSSSDNNKAEDFLRENASNRVNPIDAVNDGVLFGRKKKMGKEKVSWVCNNCGYTAGQWWGVCRSCSVSGTMKEFHEVKGSESIGKVSGFSVMEDGLRSWLPEKSGELHPIRLSEVNRGVDHLHWRIPLSGPFGNEVSRVLGGGLVPGSLTLVGGDPGVGKSTLLLQMAALIAEGDKDGEASPVVYVSGEESVEQIGNRADRLTIGSDIYLYSSTDIEDILRKVQHLSPRALVVDSVQTVYLKGIAGSPGGIIQVKECTSALLRFAKTTNIPVLLIGHVTK